MDLVNSENNNVLTLVLQSMRENHRIGIVTDKNMNKMELFYLSEQKERRLWRS